MKNNWILGLVLCTPFFVSGQSGTKPQSKDAIGQQNIHRPYAPRIADTKKLTVPIQKEKIGVRKPEYKYSITPTLFPVNPYYTEPIKPITLGNIKIPELTNKYAVMSIGNYRNLFGDIYLSSDRDKNKSYDFRAFHRSGRAPARYAGFGNSGVDLNAEKIYKRHTLRVGLDFGHRRVHHYGFFSDSIPDTMDIDADSIRSEYTHVGAHVVYDNLKNRKAKHGYLVEVNPYYFVSSRGASEWAVVADGNLREKLGEGSVLNFDLGYDYNAFTLSDGTYNRNIVRIDASYHLKKDALVAQLGFKTASDNASPPGEVVSSQNSLHFFPNVNVRYALADEYLVAYGGLTGGLMKNSLRSISELNPFIASDVNVRNTVERLRVYGGVKGSLTDEFNFNVGVGYRSLDKMLLFVNLDSALNYFTTTYSGNNTNVVKASAELQYKQYERLMLNVKANYYSYTIVNNQAWNLPTFDLKLSGRYNFQNKVIGYAEVYALNSRIGTNASKTREWSMDGAVDLGLGADYQFNPSTYFFLRLGNILHQKYMVWNGYPVQGFNFNLGVKKEF